MTADQHAEARRVDELDTGKVDVQVLDAVRPSHKEFVEQQRRDLLARFGITGDMVFQRVASLSGGERNRAALARLSASDANLLILDEPTQGVDVHAKSEIHRLMGELAAQGQLLQG